METLKSLLNQRDCQDGVIAKCNLQIQQYDLNIKSTQLKMEQMRKTMDGNIEARKRVVVKLEEAQKLRDELSSKIENFK
jgi:major membrane immunogen (membrane-anchored lipoprotein)